MEDKTKGLIGDLKEKVDSSEDVSEALMVEMSGNKGAMFLDYSKLSADTKLKRLKR